MVGVLKRGYENGEQAIEIYEGKVDLVLYNDKPDNPSFYFYRFPSNLIFGSNLGRDVTIVQKRDVQKFLKSRGIDYDKLIERLLRTALETNMTPRDEM